VNQGSNRKIPGGHGDLRSRRGLGGAYLGANCPVDKIAGADG